MICLLFRETEGTSTTGKGPLTRHDRATFSKPGPGPAGGSLAGKQPLWVCGVGWLGIILWCRIVSGSDWDSTVAFKFREAQ